MDTLKAAKMKIKQETKRFFSEYSTPQKLVVKSYLFGVIHRFYQILAIPLALSFVAFRGGHVETDTILSSVTTKVKGMALTNTTELGEQFWDVADYIIPAQEDGSFFLMTNMIITPNQTQSKCAEYPTLKSICTSDMNCTKGFKDLLGNGVQTGRCVHYSDSIKTCEVLGWCPVEKKIEPPNPAVLADAENFTIYIKNNIQFTKFNFSKINVPPNMTRSYLEKCALLTNMDPHCPIFRIKNIFEEAREDFQTMAVYGGVMAVQIQWDCEHNWDLCAPQYSFRRLDQKKPNSSEHSVHNLRFAKYYKNSDGKDVRTLIKAYGIRFDVLVYGEAKKFNFLKTILNMGALLSILRLVDWFIDVIAGCLISGYEEKKYKYLEISTNADIEAIAEIEESHQIEEPHPTTRYSTFN